MSYRHFFLLFSFTFLFEDFNYSEFEFECLFNATLTSYTMSESTSTPLGLVSKWRLRRDLLLKLRHFQMSQCYVSELEQQILSQAPLGNRALVIPTTTYGAFTPEQDNDKTTTKVEPVHSYYAHKLHKYDLSTTHRI